MNAYTSVFKNNGLLILASGSPRRREMLAGLGLEFVVHPADVDESVKNGESPDIFVKRLAQDKAAAVSVGNPETWVLAADTAVVIDGNILGKPADIDEAVAMLKGLAGRTHEVWSGFCVMNQREMVCCAVRTTVRFIEWQSDIFTAYANTGDSLDKAGGYGIQGAGGVLVREISGSYSNVVGLPLAEVMAEMIRLGVVRANRKTSS